jgi:hypothetical protein
MSSFSYNDYALSILIFSPLLAAALIGDEVMAQDPDFRHFAEGHAGLGHLQRTDRQSQHGGRKQILLVNYAFDRLEFPLAGWLVLQADAIGGQRPIAFAERHQNAFPRFDLPAQFVGHEIIELLLRPFRQNYRGDKLLRQIVGLPRLGQFFKKVALFGHRGRLQLSVVGLQYELYAFPRKICRGEGKCRIIESYSWGGNFFCSKR